MLPNGSLLTFSGDSEGSHSHASAPPRSSAVAPTLQTLCISVIATNVDSLPPEKLAGLPVAYWEDVVRERNIWTRPRQTGGGNGARKVSAIRLATISAVEKCNPDFVGDVSDMLVWKDLVECGFRRGTRARPPILEIPRGVLLASLCEAGSVLGSYMDVELSEIEGAHGETHGSRLNKAYGTLSGVKMTVDLLNESGVGKGVKKFISKGKKIDMDSVDDGDTRSKVWVASLKKFKTLLEKWMDIAKRDGVEIKDEKLGRTMNAIEAFMDDGCARHEEDSKRKELNKIFSILDATHMNVDLLNGCGAGKIVKKFIKGGNRINPDDNDACSRIWLSVLPKFESLLEKWTEMAEHNPYGNSSSAGPSPLTQDTDQDDADDLEAFKSCHTWRDLHSALRNREKKKMERTGAKVRKVRDALVRDRSRVARATVKTRLTGVTKSDRYDRILNGEKGRSSASMAARSGGPAAVQTKLGKLRTESRGVKVFQKSVFSAKPPSSGGFGNSVAGSSASGRSGQFKTATKPLNTKKRARPSILPKNSEADADVPSRSGFGFGGSKKMRTVRN
mmetsp:Transcript_12867/g.25747  ORF Transcript_12867/g.25747 Transcript_12867/m.25747 type:complete len:561 (-) Transcript_12867:463-2145(-)